MSIRSDAGADGNPGIVMMSPSSGVTKPAPADTRTSCTGTRNPDGHPRRFGSCEIDSCVFAMQTASPSRPQAA